MTREEQLNEYLKERNIPVDSLEANSIKEGIEWADEHPKKGLISLEDAISLLEEHLDKFKTEDGRPMTFCNKKDFIEGFKKAMEE